MSTIVSQSIITRRILGQRMQTKTNNGSTGHEN